MQQLQLKQPSFSLTFTQLLINVCDCISCFTRHFYNFAFVIASARWKQFVLPTRTCDFDMGQKPNVVVEWLTHLLHIREVPGSNLGNVERLTWPRFSWSSSVPRGECQDSTLKLVHDRILPNPFQLIIHLSLFSFKRRQININKRINK
jgi:hypothetical protein